MSPPSNPGVSGYNNQTYTVEFTVPRDLDGTTISPAVVVPDSSNTDPQQIYRPKVVSNLGLIDVDYVVPASGDERLGARGPRVIHQVWIDSPVVGAAGASMQVVDDVDGTPTVQQEVDPLVGVSTFFRTAPFWVPQGSMLRLVGFTNPGPIPIKVRLTIEDPVDLLAAQQAICRCASGGGGTGGGAVLAFGSQGITETTTTRFLDLWWESDNALTVDTNRMTVPRDGTLRNLHIHHGTPDGNGNDIVYTVLVNGVATVLTATLASTDATGSNVASTVSVSQGDEVSCRVTKASAIGASPNFITATVDFA